MGRAAELRCLAYISFIVEAGIVKKYQKPTLTEYGRVGELTLGVAGTEPDFTTTGGVLNLVDTACTAGLPATGCLLPST